MDTGNWTLVQSKKKMREEAYAFSKARKAALSKKNMDKEALDIYKQNLEKEFPVLDAGKS